MTVTNHDKYIPLQADDQDDGKFRPKNWKKIPDGKLRNLNPVQKSRYNAVCIN